MTADELKRNIDTVMQKVHIAANSAGHDVTLIAATKTVSTECINTAVALGITDIGENRAQEYIAKRDAVTGVRWHFIGTLQRNKAKYLVGSVGLIHSVNSIELALEIDRLAAKRNVNQDVLIEVNAADDANKTGIEIGKAKDLIDFSSTLTNITVKGIMSVPPANAPDNVYKTIYRLYDAYRNEKFDTLSVGMSGDYEKAILFGSNTVRIGTAIFGPRIYKE